MTQEPYRYEQIKQKTDKELIEEINKNVGAGALAGQYLKITECHNELNRRELDRRENTMMKYTNQVRWYTILMTLMTALILLLAILEKWGRCFFERVSIG